MRKSNAKKIAVSWLLAFVMLVSAGAAEISSLIPIGHTVGIQMSAEGVLVVHLSPVETPDGEVWPAKDAGICEGDTIIRAGGT